MILNIYNYFGKRRALQALTKQNQKKKRKEKEAFSLKFVPIRLILSSYSFPNKDRRF